MTSLSSEQPVKTGSPSHRRFLWWGLALAIVLLGLSILWFQRPAITHHWQLRRANRAFAEGRYISAYHDYKELTVDDSSQKLRLSAQKALCCFHNFNVDGFVTELAQMEGRKLQDSALAQTLDSASARMFVFLSLDKSVFLTQLQAIPGDSLQARTHFLQQSLQQDPLNLMAVYHLSDIYFDAKNYEGALALLIPALNRYPDHQGLSSLAMACHRELKQYNAAETLANNLLQKNKESLIAYTGLCRLALKQKHDAEGLRYARQAYDLDSSDASAIVSMMLAAHFNRLSPGSDYYLQKLSASPTVSARDLVYYQDLMAPETGWR